MNNSELLSYRRQLFQDAVRFRKGDRIPHLSNFVFWPILYCGYKLSEACRNWDIMEEVQRSFLDEFSFDLTRPLGTTLCNPPAMADGIGTPAHIFDDENGMVSIHDNRFLDPEDYDEFISDKNRCDWEKVLPNKYPAWNELTVGDLVKPIEEFQKYNSYVAKMTAALKEDYGLPSIDCVMGGMAGIEMMFTPYVGMKGMARDMRKFPDKIQAACESLERGTDQIISMITNPDLDESQSAFTTSLTFLSHVFLNPKQWDAFYWPRLKKILDAVVEADKTIYMFIEGKIDRFYSYFAEYPAGHIAMHLEQDDLYEARNAMPNVCLVGGLTTEVLGTATPQECVSKTKQLIDDLGSHGGFILSQNKMVSYLRDAKPENVRAVCDFVNNYHL